MLDAIESGIDVRLLWLLSVALLRCLSIALLRCLAVTLLGCLAITLLGSPVALLAVTLLTIPLLTVALLAVGVVLLWRAVRVVSTLRRERREHWVTHAESSLLGELLLLGLGQLHNER